MSSPEGKRLPGAPSRRLAAVWFADIVGFTALASRDEDAALRLVDTFQDTARREIEGHDGTLVKFMGDGALAYFTSTSAALEAAVSLRERLTGAASVDEPPLLLRFGVHVGDIVVSSTGDVFGDGVNVASRLQDEAAPGEVVVSEDVWRQCRQRDDFDFLPLGRRALKGLADPIWLYQIITGDDEDHDPVTNQHLDEARWLAVLPFDNLSGTEEAEALAAGIQNNLLTELSRVPELTVISRTSVMAYRETDKSIPQIARDLHVGSILEGTVQSAGNRVQLTVQLIDARRDIHRWAESYDRELSTENLFAIQGELTERIVTSLQAELTAEQKADDAQLPTHDLDAYRLHAQGRMQLDLRTESGFRRAIELFEGAVERDSDYALAWVGLADALTLYEDYGHGEAEEVLPRAEEAVRRALELDSSLAEAHASLGLLYSTWQDGPAAIRELERAIELRPGYAEGHSWLSWLALLVGRAEQALVSAKRAVELNPLSAEAVDHLSLSHLANGEAVKAQAEARRAEELSPGWPTALFYKALALYQLEELEEARAVLEGLEVPWTGQGPAAMLALCHAGLGDPSEARAVLSRIQPHGDHFAIGLVQLGLGETEEALTSFETIDQLGPWPSLAVHHFYQPVWDLIGDDGRYADLVRQAERSWRLDR